MKQLRILGRSIRDAFKSVFRNFSLSMASISCITITLLIVAISMVLSYNIENISTLIKKDFSIVVFVENNATDEDIKNIKEQIEKLISSSFPEFNIPKKYIFRDELPLTGMSKIDFKQLELESLEFIDNKSDLIVLNEEEKNLIKTKE